MMIKSLFLLVALICASMPAMAQRIAGRVTDTASKPISYATVVLCNAADTTQVDYTITDIEGKFSFESPSNKERLLYISFIGYKPKYLPAKENMVVVLQQDAYEIDEVVVKGTRPISKMTSEGVQTTVANTVLSNMGTGNDVLKRIPMVSGDNGLFKVFGRGAARIYINNREVRDPSELDNLNSTDIQNIEVISNPGARYDASVKAVINIKTVRKQGDGFSFNARSSFSTWENQDYINQINTNYRRGGLDVFANVDYSDITLMQRGDMFQTTIIDTLWQQNNYMDAEKRIYSLDGTLGANYEINNNHNVGFRYEMGTTPRNDYREFALQSDVYANGVLFDKWKNIELTNTKGKISSQVNIYYVGKIDKLSIDFNADYTNSGSESNGINTEQSDNDGARVLNSSSYIDNELWATKLQLSYPVLGGNLSLGGEYVDITRNDEYINEDLVGFSSKVDIAEQNTAFFTQYRIESKIGNFVAGVRYENAKYNYLVDDVVDSDKSREYARWFPNFSYSNRFGKVDLQLSYNSKITRPSYSQLSKNLLYGNRFTINTGNPYLKPSIDHSLSLTGMWKFLQVQVSYTNQKDAIVMWVDRYKEDPKVSVMNYKNISELPLFSTFITAAPTFGVYQPQLTVGVQRYWQDYSSYGVDVDMRKPMYFTFFNNIFELPHNITVNLDAAFISKGYMQAAYIYQNSFELGFGVSKSFFDKSLQVKLSVTDITNQSSASITVMPQYTEKNLYYFNNRRVELTLRYSFNSAKNKYKGNGAGAAAKRRF